MKRIIYITISMIALALIIIVTQSCKEDELEVPQASTQANFDYEVTEIVIDKQEGIIHYEVKLFNKSLQAQSYLWDFGNGETSMEENPVVVYTSSGKYTITLTVTALNDLYYNKLTKSESFAFGKQVILFEDFYEGLNYLDEDSWAPEGWKAIDDDGDGFNWYPGYRLFDGDTIVSLRSQSWTSASGALTPDNWLITPDLNLTDYGEGATITFRYTVGITANTPEYRKEHYGVFIAIGNDDLSSFVLLFEETFTEDTPRMTPLERNLDIELNGQSVAGKIIYMAIRHYNISDMDRMFVEEVELYVIE